MTLRVALITLITLITLMVLMLYIYRYERHRYHLQQDSGEYVNQYTYEDIPDRKSTNPIVLAWRKVN